MYALNVDYVQVLTLPQHLKQVFKGNNNCSDLYAPWAWMSAYTSVNPELWNTLICSENNTWLEQMLMTSLIPVTEKVWGHTVLRIDALNMITIMTISQIKYVITGRTVGWHCLWKCEV